MAWQEMWRRAFWLVGHIFYGLTGASDDISNRFAGAFDNTTRRFSRGLYDRACGISVASAQNKPLPIFMTELH